MPAVSRFGVLGLAFVACWTANPPTGVTPSQPIESTADLTGAYWCSITEDGFEYPRYPCVIKTVDGELVLAKLFGALRFRGRITPDRREGFSFEGEVFCPDDDCQRELHGRFRPMRGGFQGKFRDESIVVQVVSAPRGAFGGSSYATDEAFELGAIGGYEYAGFDIDSRGRRRP